jgi:large subunit ribosomal protein L24
MRIKKGDSVKIIKGKDRGKPGKVLKVFPDEDRVLVEGMNIFKKHVRPRRQGEKGEIVQVARPISVSNVALVCSQCSRATRVGYHFQDGKKIRYCRKCGQNIQ